MKETTWAGTTAYQCEECGYTAETKRQVVKHLCRGPKPPKLSGLAVVKFASGRAEEVARNAGLNPRDFAGEEPSGATGFTTDDVRAIVDDTEE